MSDDRLEGSQKKPATRGSAGVINWGSRLKSVGLENVTIHSSYHGVRIGDMGGCHFDLETETTNVPFLVTYNAVGCSARVDSVHGDCLAEIGRARWDNFSLSLSGTVDRSLHCVKLPDGAKDWLSRQRERSQDLFSFSQGYRATNGRVYRE